MLGHIQHKRLNAVCLEVFRNLQTDIARANDNRACNTALSDQITQGNRIFRRTHEKHVFKIHARDRRINRACAGGDHQLVIAEGLLFAGSKVHSGHLLCRAVNLRRLGTDKHLCAGQALVLCRSVNNQLFLLANDVAHIIRQAAAGIGDILALIKNHNLIAAVFAHQLRRNFGTGSNAAQNNDLHSVSPFRVKPTFLYCPTVLLYYHAVWLL